MKLCVLNNCLPIQHPPSTSIWQWHPIQQLYFLPVLHWPEHQELLLYTTLLVKQRPNWSHQQDHIRLSKKMVREGQRKLSWRVPECLMGLPDNSKETNWRIVIFYSLWNGGRHSNRNWSTHKTYNFSRRKHPFSLNRVCFGPNQQKVGWDDHKMPAYHQRVMVQYNRRVWSRKFHLRDLILQYVFKNTKESRDGKLGPNW